MKMLGHSGVGAGGAPQTSGDLRSAIAACRSAFAGVALLSGAVNVLYLTGSFYMLEVYDRVVPSRSVPTLIGISIIAGFLFTFHGLLEIVRNRILSRVGAILDARLSRRVFGVILSSPAAGDTAKEGLAPLRDLDQVRGFVSSQGPTAFFDVPWIPLYLGICFAFHPYVGFTTLGGATVLFVLALLTESASRQPASLMARAAGTRIMQAEAMRTNAEVVHALGMRRTMTDRWSGANNSYRSAMQKSSDIVSALSGLAKTLRMMLQAADIGARRMARDQRTGDRRHHHRKLDSHLPRARPRRARHRELERLRRGTAGLEEAQGRARERPSERGG